MMQAYPAEEASAPFSHPSCLAGVVSRSQRWFVWTPSPPHSGNKPSWSLKSSPHELKSPSDKGRRAKPHAKYQINETLSVRFSTSYIQVYRAWQALCRIWPSLLVKLLSSVKYLTALSKSRAILQATGTDSRSQEKYNATCLQAS